MEDKENFTTRMGEAFLAEEQELQKLRGSWRDKQMSNEEAVVSGEL